MSQARLVTIILATGALLLGVVGLAAPVQARTSVTCSVSSIAQINTCFTNAALGTDKDITLVVNNDITATESIAAVTVHATNTLLIDGNDKLITLGSFRGFDITMAQGQTLTINNLRTTGGSTSGDGGALLVRGGRLSANNIKIQNATANGYGGGIALNDSDVTHTISRSVITGNTATTQSGGGIYSVGAVTLVNSTVYNNTAASGGGLNVSAGSSSGVSSIQFSTISGNIAGTRSSNIDAYTIGTQVRLIGSVLSNPLGAAARNCQASVLSASYSVIGNASGNDTSCGAAATNQLRLATTSAIALASFDTNTSTFVPANNSDLVNYAPDALSTGITTDQTGATRSGAFTAGSVQVAMPSVSASPSSAAFGTVTTGSTSSATTFAISNSGSDTLTFGAGAANLSGTHASDFSIATDTCSSASIPIGATCVIGVTFTPGANGARSASLVLTDNATDSPQSISLTGTGGTSDGGLVKWHHITRGHPHSHCHAISDPECHAYCSGNYSRQAHGHERSHIPARHGTAHRWSEGTHDCSCRSGARRRHLGECACCCSFSLDESRSVGTNPRSREIGSCSCMAHDHRAPRHIHHCVTNPSWVLSGSEQPGNRHH